MAQRTFQQGWDAMGETHAPAANMVLRSDILVTLCHHIEGWGLTQAEAARRLGITQPRLNDLVRGRVGNFSLDALVNLAEQAGLSLKLEIREKAIA